MIWRFSNSRVWCQRPVNRLRASDREYFEGRCHIQKVPRFQDPVYFPQDTLFVSRAVFPDMLEDAGGNDKFMGMVCQVKAVGVFPIDSFELEGLLKKIITTWDVKKIVTGIVITRLLIYIPGPEKVLPALNPTGFARISR